MVKNTRVYFDLETDGLIDPQITQIAAVAVVDGVEAARFNTRVQFDVTKADQTALEIIGYTPEKWADAVTPALAAKAFCDFLNKFKTIQMTSKAGKPYKVAQLCGYNAAVFDGPIIQKFMKDQGVFFPASYKILDVFQLVLWYFQVQTREPESHKLQPVCEWFDISLTDAHDALNDVVATAALGELMIQRLSGR